MLLFDLRDGDKTVKRGVCLVPNTHTHELDKPARMRIQYTNTQTTANTAYKVEKTPSRLRLICCHSTIEALYAYGATIRAKCVHTFMALKPFHKDRTRRPKQQHNSIGAEHAFAFNDCA